jgi:hypothetical protein
MACLTCKLPASSGLSRADFCFREIPGGAIDCNNLTFTTAFEFHPGSLEVLLDANPLNELEYTEAVDNKGFTLVLSPGNPNLLQSAPRKSESIRVNYIKSDSLGTVGDCIVYL